MKLIFRKLAKNEFINASFYSGISTVIKIFTSLLIGKIIAKLSGAEGMVLYGQLLSFVVLVSVFSGGAITQGITKYVAEYNVKDKNKIPILISTSFKITFYFSILAAAIMILFSKYISNYILYSSKYSLVFIVFGITVIFYSLNAYLLSILNGFKKFKKFNIVNIIVNIGSLVFTIVLSYYYSILGTLLSVVLNQSIIFFITLYFLKNEVWFKKSNFTQKINKIELKLLSGFALIAVFSTAIAPISSIVIRNFIIEHVSISEAGLYEFLIRVSGSVMLFFSITISTYYIPRISEIQDRSEMFREIKKTYIIVLPILVLLLSIVFFLRIYFIKILATNEFLPTQGLFIYILIGVFFRISTQILGFVFLSKAKIKIIIFVEIIYNIIFTLVSVLLIGNYALKGAVYAFLLCNFLYFIGVFIVSYFTFVFKNKQHLLIR